MNYQSIKLDKSMYKASGGFSACLEALDPTANYATGELAQYDAFQRQLKRFDIRVSGAGSDAVEKFFSTADSSALFPEYVARAVKQGVDDSGALAAIIASKTLINSMDYRSITSTLTDEADAAHTIDEGAKIPETSITLSENLVRLVKRGRLLKASYEAIRFQRLDLFTVALKQIGQYIAVQELKGAVDVLLNGDGNTNPAQGIETAQAGKLTYADLISLWSEFDGFKMNTMVAAPDMVLKMLAIEELRNPAAGLNFQGTGAIGTPLGATLIQSSAVPQGTIIGLDKAYALEMVSAGGITVDYDKLIDCQLERAAITSVSGFAKIFPDAVKVLTLKA